MNQLTYVQTCRQCGLKQSASYEHQSDCFGSCDSNTRKMRSFDEVKNKLTQLESMHEAHKDEREYAQIDILKWVLGELDV